jgi:periplasmic protein TonB
MAHGVQARFAGPFGASALLHLALVALVVWTFRPGPPVVLPPIYKINIVAAPPGPRAIGEVTPGQAPAKPAPTPPKMRDVPPKEPVAPVKKVAPVAAKKATPKTAKTAKNAKKSEPKPQQAGGGPTGGHGADVATVQTEGIDFPYPGYLNNIVRQIALNFKPQDPNSPVRAEVAFLIHRDGSVTNFRFITRSGVYTFDLEAQGAVEKASAAFGPLPDGFGEDVLPVVFSFDPKFLR